VEGDPIPLTPTDEAKELAEEAKEGGKLWRRDLESWEQERGPADAAAALEDDVMESERACIVTNMLIREETRLAFFKPCRSGDFSHILSHTTNPD
jgi:hypothetical protein